MKYSDEIKEIIKNEYIDGWSINRLAIKYNIPYATIKYWVKKLPKNGTDRFFQKYKIKEDYAEIYIKYNGNYVIALIDIEDVEKCKKFGIWSLTKAGYVINYKSGVYLHRLVMDCPDDKEVDHIFHNLLDNRKSMLRLASSSQQKMNTHRRTDNVSGHRGVYYDSNRNKWAVSIQNKNNRIRKRLNTYEEACEYCDIMLEKLHKDFKYSEEECGLNACVRC